MSGDWAGAVRAVGTGAGATLGIALAAVLVAGGTGTSEAAGRVVQICGLALGGSLTNTAESPAAFRPLGPTMVGLAVIVTIFVRQLRRSHVDDRAAVGWQALRVLTVHAGVLLVLCVLSFLSSNWFNIPLTLLGGLALLAVALVIGAAIGLPATLPSFVASALSGPLRGAVFLICSSCALVSVGVLGFTLAAVGLDGRAWREEIATLLLAFPNIAAAALHFGLGVPVSANIAARFDVVGRSDLVTVFDGVGSDLRLWLAPVVAAGLVVIAGYIAAGSGPAVRTSLGFGAVLPLALLVLAAGLSEGSWGEGLGPLSFGGQAGVDGRLAGVVGLSVGCASGLVGAAMRPPTSVLALTRTVPHRPSGPGTEESE